MPHLNIMAPLSTLIHTLGSSDDSSSCWIPSMNMRPMLWSMFLALDWPGLNCFQDLRSEPMDERSWSVSLSAFKINKLYNLKLSYTPKYILHYLLNHYSQSTDCSTSLNTNFTFNSDFPLLVFSFWLSVHLYYIQILRCISALSGNFSKQSSWFQQLHIYLLYCRIKLWKDINDVFL